MRWISRRYHNKSTGESNTLLLNSHSELHCDSQPNDWEQPQAKCTTPHPMYRPRADTEARSIGKQHMGNLTDAPVLSGKGFFEFRYNPV